MGIRSTGQRGQRRGGEGTHLEAAEAKSDHETVARSHAGQPREVVPEAQDEKHEETQQMRPNVDGFVRPSKQTATQEQQRLEVPAMSEMGRVIGLADLLRHMRTDSMAG